MAVLLGQELLRPRQVELPDDPLPHLPLLPVADRGGRAAVETGHKAVRVGVDRRDLDTVSNDSSFRRMDRFSRNDAARALVKVVSRTRESGERVSRCLTLCSAATVLTVPGPPVT